MIGSHSDGDSSGNSDVGRSLIKKTTIADSRMEI